MHSKPQFPKKQVAILSIIFLLCFLFTLFNSCKKNDFSTVQPTHEAGFVQKFFSLKHPVNDTVAGIMAKLKAENDRTGFVNKLPTNCGLPIWDKLVMKYKKALPSFAAGEDSAINNILIPLTTTNQDLSAIIVATPVDSSYFVDCYTSNGYLYNIIHDTAVNLTYSTGALITFMQMEYKTFGTTAFYHIPARFFPAYGKLDSIGDKTVNLAPPPAVGDEDGDCIWLSCGLCPGGVGLQCINGGNTGGGGGGGPTGTGGWPGDGPPSSGGTGSTGSGSNGPGGSSPPGNGSSTGGTGTGNPCPLAGTWYGLMAPPGGCGGGTSNPPPIPTADTCDPYIAVLESDATFTAYMHSLNTNAILGRSSETGYELRKNGISTDYIQKIGSDDYPQITWDIPANTKQKAVIHAHYAGLNNIFTPEDVILMAQIFILNHAADSNNLFFGVTSNYDMPFLMKVGNVAQFRSFCEKIVGVNGNDDDKMKDFKSKFYKKIDSENNGNNETEFLKLLKNVYGVNKGLVLYTGNNACTQWTKREVDNSGIVHDKPCLNN